MGYCSVPPEKVNCPTHTEQRMPGPCVSITLHATSFWESWVAVKWVTEQRFEAFALPFLQPCPAALKLIIPNRFSSASRQAGRSIWNLSPKALSVMKKGHARDGVFNLLDNQQV